MISVLCCGPCFDERALVEEGPLYNFVDLLLHSREEKVRTGEAERNVGAIFGDTDVLRCDRKWISLIKTLLRIYHSSAIPVGSDSDTVGNNTL